MKTVLAAFAASLLARAAFAQGTLITYQGVLATSGSPANGFYDCTFQVYDAAASGSPVGPSVTTNAVAMSNGLFVVTLDFGAGVFAGPPRWLEIAVKSNGVAGQPVLLTPRQRLTAAPYAITAGNITGTLPAGQLTGTLPSALLSGTYAGALSFSSGGNNFTGNGSGLTGVNAASLGSLPASGFWQTGGNGGTTAAQFLGTTDNKPLEMKVNGARALRLEPSVGVPNVIGGSVGNSVATNTEAATIAGGGLPSYPNRVTASYATIGGGTFNTASGGWATVAGGRDNTASGSSGSVGGGYNNVASGYGATVPGGDHCVAAGDYSFAAGARASANHRGSFVWCDGFPLFGLASSADYQFLVSAGGGAVFSVYDAAFQVQGSALISKAATTWATARQFAISHTGDGNWGLNLGYFFNPGVQAGGVIQALDAGNPAWLHINPAGGQVLLGSGSEVSWGDHAFSKLTPDQGGSIELGNSQWSPSMPYIDFHFSVGFPQDFNVRLQNDGNNVLTCSGNFRALTLTPTSDRNAKENFQAVDPQAILERVAALPITEWNFKVEPGVKHVGPVAQDFQAAFAVGMDDKHIATVDADGVALAAIQGLNQKLEETRAELKRRDAENAELRARLERLERLLPHPDQN